LARYGAAFLSAKLDRAKRYEISIEKVTTSSKCPLGGID